MRQSGCLTLITLKQKKKNSEDVYINTCRCVHIKLQQGGSVLVLHLGTREIVALSATEAG